MLKGEKRVDNTPGSGRRGRNHRCRHKRRTVLYVFDPMALLAILLAIFYTLFGGFGQMTQEDSAAIAGEQDTASDTSESEISAGESASAEEESELTADESDQAAGESDQAAGESVPAEEESELTAEESESAAAASESGEVLQEEEASSSDGGTLLDDIASIFDSWFGGDDGSGASSGGLLSFWSGFGGWSSDVYTGDYEGLAELDEEHLALDEETGIEYVDNTILVLVEDGLTNAQKESIALSVDGVVIGEYEGMAGLLQIEVEVSSLAELEALAEELEENELVYYACYDYVAEYDWEEETESGSEDDVPDSASSETTAQSSSISGDWWRDAINVERAWEEFGDCFGEVCIGVVDSGIDISQSDVSGKILFTTPFQETRNESVVEADSSDANHGTAVTSIIIADQDDVGTDGIAEQATLYFSAYSEATSISSKHRVSLMLCQTLEEANAGCRVINHSSGYLNKGYSEEMIAYSAEIMGELTGLLVKSGWDGLIVQTAGNDGDDASGNGFWATYKSGSSDLDDHILIVTGVEAVESGSSVDYRLYAGYAYGDAVDICAPAVSIELPWDGSYDSRRGTSYAAPMVTAAAGLIWSADPDMTAAEVKDCLVNGYRFELTSSVSGDTYPMLDVYSAVERALCCVLEGMVVDEDGAPAEGITVQAVDADGNVLDEAITGANGSYVLRSNRLTTDHLSFLWNEEEVAALDYPEEYRTYDADAARSDDEEGYDPHGMEDVIVPLLTLSASAAMQDDPYSFYQTLLENRVSSGEWNQELEYEMCIEATYEGETHAIKYYNSSAAAVSGYDGEDLSGLNLTGRGCWGLYYDYDGSSVYYEWTCYYADGLLNYSYTEPSAATGQGKLEDAFFCLPEIEEAMVTEAELSDGTLKFTIPAEYISVLKLDDYAEGLTAMGNSAESMEYTDITVIVYYAAETVTDIYLSFRSYDIFPETSIVSDAWTTAEYELHYVFSDYDAEYIATAGGS